MCPEISALPEAEKLVMTIGLYCLYIVSSVARRVSEVIMTKLLKEGVFKVFS